MNIEVNPYIFVLRDVRVQQGPIKKKQHCCFVCENYNEFLVFYLFEIEKRVLSKMVMDSHNVLDFAKTKLVYLSKKNSDPLKIT